MSRQNKFLPLQNFPLQDQRSMLTARRLMRYHCILRMIREEDFK